MKPTTTKDANKGAATAPPPPDAKAGDATVQYDEFEPFCGWRREEGKETLEVHVPEFKKDQIKAHISNRGTLRITGERPVDGTRRSRFTKEIKVPTDCNTSEITAKFTSAGILYVTMPKKTPIELETKQDEPMQVEPQQAQAQAQDLNEQPKTEGAQGQVAEESRMEFPGAEQTVTRGRKVVISVALAAVVVVVVALGALATYSYTRPEPNV